MESCSNGGGSSPSSSRQRGAIPVRAAKPRMTGSLSEARWLPVSQLPLQGRTTGVTTQVIDTMDVAGTQPTTQHGGQHGEKRTDEGDP